MASADELAVADTVGTSLSRLVRLVERVKVQHQATHPDAIERATYHLLVRLVNDGPQRAVALAEAVCSDQSTISRQVAQLVKLGYVERTADPDDGRATLLAATAEGRRVFAENRRRRSERIAGMLADWPEADRTALADLLGRFTAEFEKVATRHAGSGGG